MITKADAYLLSISGNPYKRGFLTRFDGEHIGIRVLDCGPRTWKYFNLETEQKELKEYLSSFQLLPIPHWEDLFEEN